MAFHRNNIYFMIKKFHQFNESKHSTCEKLCKECPFSVDSPKGWLADYSVDDIKEIMNQEALFPCHMLMAEGDMTQYQVQKAIEQGEMKLCRGYIESMIKSGKLPRYNILLKEEIDRVKQEGLSENSMPIWEFIKHHSK